MALQDEQTVSFDPMSVDGPQPWYVTWFVLYLLVVLLTVLIRSITTILSIRRLRRKSDTQHDVDLSEFLGTCYDKVRPVKNLSMLTLLISLIVLGWSAINAFAQVEMQKTTGIHAIAGALAEALTSFTMGISFCTIIFSCGMFLEYLVARQRRTVDRAKDTLNPTEMQR